MHMQYYTTRKNKLKH